MRRRKQLSQEKLADLIGVHRTTYARYELDDNQADYERLVKLADYHQVTIDYLLGRTSRDNAAAQNEPVCLQSLKEIRRKIADGNVTADIPESRIPFLIDILDKEITVIEQQLSEQEKEARP